MDDDAACDCSDFAFIVMESVVIILNDNKAVSTGFLTGKEGVMFVGGGSSFVLSSCIKTLNHRDVAILLYIDALVSLSMCLPDLVGGDNLVCDCVDVVVRLLKSELLLLNIER